MELGAITPWVNGGAVGILSFVALLVFLGKLLPSATVDRLIRPYEQRIISLEKALDLEIQRGGVRDIQFEKLVDLSRTTNELVTTLSRAAERQNQ